MLGATAEDVGNTAKMFDEDHDMLESLDWIDGELVYPSIGMVFELAFLKCHFLCLLQNGGGEKITPSTHDEQQQNEELMKRLENVGQEELKRQAHMLLSLVHKWNSHLLPKLGEETYSALHGASFNSSSISKTKGNATIPRSPPALDTLLNIHPPGFELQYSYGNPGGGSMDEAASIWQRDMILWHVINPSTMEYLSQFCKALDANLVDTSVLTGSKDATNDSAGNAQSNNSSINMEQRREAEELVAKLQRENPDRTMDQIMMHPEMAALMIQHLHTE